MISNLKWNKLLDAYSIFFPQRTLTALFEKVLDWDFAKKNNIEN